MHTPKVSVLIPCYNYGRFVDQAISSILAQTDPDLELVVVDNGSTDNSWEVIQGFADPRLKTLRLEKNRGIRGAWVVGMELCRGEWFSFVSADDYVAPHKHEVLLKFAAQHPEVDVISAYVEHVDQHGVRVPEEVRWMEMVINEPRDLNVMEAWMMRHYVCMPAALYRRRFCQVIPAGSDAVSDYNFHLHFIQSGRLFAQVPELVAFYRSHGDNTTMQMQPRAAQHWAYCYAAQFLPYLRSSGQEHRAREAIDAFFGLYFRYIRDSTRQQKGIVLLCMFWPDWVMQHCPEYELLEAFDWESRVDGHHFHAVHAMVGDAFSKWTQPEAPPTVAPKVPTPAPALTPQCFPNKSEKKGGPLRVAARNLERRVRRFIRGTK